MNDGAEAPGPGAVVRQRPAGGRPPPAPARYFLSVPSISIVR